MCGIAGIVKLDPTETVDEARLKRMRDVLRHRGPDGEGLWVDGPVGLGHRRLAIVDVAGGHQPMDERGRVVLDRLQRRDLQPRRRSGRALEARGHRYRTRERHRDDPAPLRGGGRALRRAAARHVRLRPLGPGRGRLLLARDRLGIKPLYYAVTDGELLFASEIKAILAADGDPARASTRRSCRSSWPRASSPARRPSSGACASSLPGHTLTWSLGDGLADAPLLAACRRATTPRPGLATERGGASCAAASRTRCGAT